MTRLRLFLACVLSALTAATAHAQYSGRGMTPPEQMPLSPDAMMTQGTYPPAAQYHQQIPAPPRVKLPPGVKAENGLLYYNGNAYGDVNPNFAASNAGYQYDPSQYSQGQFNPGQYNSAMFAPYQQALMQQAAYQQAAMDQSGGSVMAPGGQYGPQGGPMQQGCNGDCNGNCNGNCNGGGEDCHCSDSCFHRPLLGFPGKLGFNWTAGVDALAMTRNTAVDRALVLFDDTGNTAFRTSEFNFDMEAGVRAFIGLTGPSGIQYQGVYMNVPNWSSSETVDSANNLQIPFPLASSTVDFFGADEMTLRYNSHFQSAEANVIVPWGNFQFLGGYRYCLLDETAVIQAFDFDDGDVSRYDVGARNVLNGGQVGILGEWEFLGHINFDFFAKTGVFCNSSSEHQTLQDFGGSILLRDTSGKRTDVAYVSELAAQVVVPLGAFFSIQGGYRVLFLNQMATAPNQFDFTDNLDSGTHVTTSSNIVMHGANLGVTAKW